MSIKLDKNARKWLVDTDNFRDFITKVIELRSTDQRKFGYADLARSAGFVSRSFPREVVKGNKTLTLDSLRKMAKGLGLSKDLIQYFTYLVELEVESCRDERKSVASIEKSLKNLKSRIVQKENDILKINDGPFANKFFPRIFAALGSELDGASTAEVKRRTNLTEETIITSLKSLEELGLVVRKGTRFYPQISHPSLQNLKSDSQFKKYFKVNVEEILKGLDADYTKDHCLFFNSCFIISTKDEIRFKEELRELLLNYVDEHDTPTGDKVVSLTCSLR